MNKGDLIRAWKASMYRSTPGAAELGALPAHPTGIIELCDADLRGVGGAVITSAKDCTINIFLGWRACGCA